MNDINKKWMLLALEEAYKGIGLTSPNPSVGAIIVKAGKLLGKGWHHKAGTPHAERKAIADVIDKHGKEVLKGSSIYVTLEPCSTFGKTPPCTEGIIDAGIVELFYGADDPNPNHLGGAKKILEEKGIKVTSGICEKECMHLIRAFSKVQTKGLPWVIVKSAMSLDGKITRPPGESQWLSSPESRNVVQRIRYESDAIITGGNTLRADNPSLTIRDSEYCGKKEQPWRMIITRKGASSLPEDAKVFTDQYKTRTLVQENGDILKALETLVNLGCQTVMVEAGGSLIGSFLELGLVDEIAVFYTPLITGGNGHAFNGAYDGINLTDQSYQKIGNDVYFSALVAHIE